MLSGCVTRDPRLVSALQTTSVATVEVETAPDVRKSWLSVAGKPDPGLPAVVTTLKSTMAKELTGLPGGAAKGRLIVTLHRVDVASKAGRVIAGSNSYIEGSARLEDAATGRLIAQAPNIRAEDRGVKGGGLGIVVAVAINAAATSGDEDALARRLAQSFTKQVRDWLTQK
ncbi:hypothetical protein C7U60_20175 [Mesorhizobium plurifarium]|uniref:hypothetical protein n=1 Tax=Sinorhizobium arboris TaxID=76745 RepID=UPI00040650D8|nr:hypothetical protein [Sinorhizobium arboris]PST17596.1 hypothetical protein C7U60_20175 [Mesorhizobium plurifarium]